MVFIYLIFKPYIYDNIKNQMIIYKTKIILSVNLKTQVNSFIIFKSVQILIQKNDTHPFP